MIRRNNKTASPLTRYREELPLIGVSLVLALGITSLQALSSAQEEDPLLSITILPESGEERTVPAGGRIHLTALGHYATQDIPVRSRWDLLDRSTAEGRLVRCDSTTRCAVEAAEGSEGELVVRAGAEGQTADAVLTVIPVRDNPFTDELPDWASEAIITLYDLGIIQGYEDGSFGAGDPVTRGQLITLLYRVIRHADLIEDQQDCMQYYIDISADHYAYVPACAYHRFAIGGQDDDFEPDVPALRGSAAALISHLLAATLFDAMGLDENIGQDGHQIFADVPRENMYFLETTYMNATGVITGYPNGEFGVADQLNRAQAAIIVSRILDRIESYGITGLWGHGAAGEGEAMEGAPFASGNDGDEADLSRGSSQHQWSVLFANEGDQRGDTVAVDVHGNSYVAGRFTGTVDFRGSVLEASDSDIFLASYTPNGALRRVRAFGGDGFQYPHGIAVDNDGSVVVVGVNGGTVDFGDGVHVSDGMDVFVAKFDRNGEIAWSRQYGGDRTDSAEAVVVDESGNIYITGYFQNTIDFGGESLFIEGYDAGIFVAKFDARGNYLWSEQIDRGTVEDIAVGNDGSVVVGWGRSTGTVARIHSDGTEIWRRSLPGVEVKGVTIDDGGNVLITGGAGVGGVVLVRFDGNGNEAWRRTYGNRGQGYDVVTDENGAITFTGYFSGGIDFGGGVLSSVGGFDIFVASLASNGVHRWSRHIGSGEQNNFGIDIAVARGVSGVFVTGYSEGDVNFGGGTLSGGGYLDAFLVKYAR